MNWVVHTPGRDLSGEEKKLFTRGRQVLWDYEPLRASHAEIRVEISGQMVRLSGRVRTLPQRTMAELLVQRLKGVESVVNELVADPVVVRAVADALARDERTAPYVLGVEVRHGVVTVRGSVPDEDTLTIALEIASRVSLVAAVRSEVDVSGPVLPPFALRDAPSLPEAQAALSSPTGSQI